jgi:4-hydroxyacetophenone monooxygenase
MPMTVDANHNMAWGASNVHSCYKNDLGRVSQNWPYPLREYWQRTQEVTPSDFVICMTMTSTTPTMRG